jgi:hypothetical protein
MPAESAVEAPQEVPQKYPQEVATGTSSFAAMNGFISLSCVKHLASCKSTMSV